MRKVQQYIILLLLSTVFMQNYSLYFDGDDTVNLGHHDEFVNPNLSIQLDFKIASFTGNSGSFVVKADCGTNACESFNLYNIDGILYYIIFTPGFYQNHNCISDGPVVELNTWYNLAVTNDMDRTKMYLDGVLIVDVEGSPHMNYAESDVLFGRNFNGHLDNIYIYNRTLDHEEILENIDKSSTWVDLGLIGSWDCNTGYGQITYDTSGNDFDGTIYGATWVENIEGCTDELACNYNEFADINDGTCSYECYNNGNYSLSFNGNGDNVNCGFIDPTNDIQSNGATWHGKISKANSSNNIGVIASKWVSGANSQWAIGYDENEICLTLRGGGVDDLDYNYYCSEGFGLNDSLIEFTVYWNDQSVEFYKNRNFISSVETDQFNLNIISTPQMIGSHSIGSEYLAEYSFNGTIDYMIISNEILSFENLDNPNEGYLDYRFNTGFENTLYDYSGNQNHGTIYGAKWVTSETIKYVSLESLNELENGSEEYPFNSIQEAISYSINGDSILVSAGTYYENINFNEKNISIIGENKENTIIDGDGHTVIEVVTPCQNCLISNLTIQNGSRNGGGGIYIHGENFELSVNIENLLIQNNHANDKGGGLHIYHANATLNNIIFLNNTSASDGGGLYSINSEISISNSLFIDNHSNFGGAITNHGSDSIFYIDKCLFTNNSASDYGSAIHLMNTNLSVNNSTFFQNINSSVISLTSSFNYENIDINNSIFNNNFPEIIVSEPNNNINISYSMFDNTDYFDNITGTSSTNNIIYGDPQFIDPNNGNFNLQSSSQCIDSGDPNSTYDPDGTIADMGAYPFFQIPGCIDELAVNTDSQANTDDGSCLYDYSINLNDNANLISFMALPEDNSVSNVMESLGGSIVSVIGQGIASSYNPTLGWIGSLSSIELNQGYWLIMSESATLTLISPDIPGSNSPEYTLNEGANLISFPYDGAYAIEDVLPDNIQVYITGIIGQGLAATQNPTLGWIGSLEFLEGSKGYWFKVSEPIEFQFINPSR